MKVRLNLHGIVSVESATLLEEEEFELPVVKDQAKEATGIETDAKMIQQVIGGRERERREGAKEFTWRGSSNKGTPNRPRTSLTVSKGTLPLAKSSSNIITSRRISAPSSSSLAST
ncbi:heat shock 70 kDa protein 15-like isoform X1 [Diospyros lotus]|uniref:heat shock 70 kDa protein 15-like isoform X1 n=1 Tax=Diospyros lotus TaxID=55363 RepID=UPI002252BB42|nr:heat shock 70 kDa protein 15-like isoform X1 [Diospyros lotus]